MSARLQPLLCLAILISLYKGLEGSDDEKRLLGKLFHSDNHDINVRPVRNTKDSINVTLTLTLYQLIEIEEKHQTIVLSAWLTTKWHDYQMTWNPDDFNGLKTFNTRPETIWLPDVVLYNNVNEDNAEYGGNMDTLKTRVKVYHTGDMFWIAPLIIKGHCEIHVNDFPFDTQKCSLKFGSWTYDLNAMDIRSGGIDISPYSPNLEWNLASESAVRNEVKYDCCPNIYPDVTFHLNFQRRSMFYVLNLIFPIAMITVLTIVAFILPQESGERIGLSVTLMLAVTVFMLLVAETTPDSSEGLPIVAVYFIFCILVIFFIIVLLCYVSRLYNRAKTDRPMSLWMKRWILDYLSYKLHIRHRHGCCSETKNILSSKEEVPTEIIHSDRDNQTSNGTSNGGVDGTTVVLRGSNGNNTQSWVQKPLIEGGKNDGENHDDDGDDDGGDVLTFEEEWRCVAMTIDRIMLISFSILFIVGTIGCFAHTKYVV